MKSFFHNFRINNLIRGRVIQYGLNVKLRGLEKFVNIIIVKNKSDSIPKCRGGWVSDLKHSGNARTYHLFLLILFIVGVAAIFMHTPSSIPSIYPLSLLSLYDGGFTDVSSLGCWHCSSLWALATHLLRAMTPSGYDVIRLLE